MHVQKFVADMAPALLPNGQRWGVHQPQLRRLLRLRWDPPRIHGSGKPQQNAMVESVISRALKSGHAARRVIRRPFPGVDLAGVPNIGVNGNRLWLEAVLWAADCFNRSETKINTGWRSPYKVFFSRPPKLRVVPFLPPGVMHVTRATKSDVQSVSCFFLNNEHIHSTPAVKVKATISDVCYTSDVVWTVPRAPVLPAPVVVGRSRYAAASATPGFSITYSPPPPPLPSPQRISGRTRSKTVWFSATPAVEFPATHEEARSPSPVESGRGLWHSIGLISMLDKTTLQGMVTTTGAVDAVRYKKSGVSGGCRLQASSVGSHTGTPTSRRGGGSRVPSRRCWRLGRTSTPPPAVLRIRSQGSTELPGGHEDGSRPSLGGLDGARFLRSAGCGDLRVYLATS